MNHSLHTPHEQRLLFYLADPAALPPPVNELNNPQQLGRILLMAKAHGVFAIVARKLRALELETRSLPTDVAQLLVEFEGQRALAVGQTMLLDHHAQRIQQRIEQEQIPAVIVKGPAFASRLYQHRGDRSYTDIDLLTAADAIPRLNQIMPELGFSQPNKIWDNSHRDQEYKWLLDSNRSVLIEVHGNLVHYPALRRCVSFGYEEYALARELGGGEGIADLMVAIMHSACGHKFHRLNMLLDVLQAARSLPEGATGKLQRVAQRLGAWLETGVTLGVVGELFQDEKVAGLAQQFSSHWTVALGRRLISARAVLCAQPISTTRSKLQRHGFRQLQQLGWLRP